MKSIQKSIFLFVLLIVSAGTFAQSIKIEGKLFSQEGDSLPGASVMLIGAQDSILKTFAITKKDGTFALTGVKKGNYIVKASFFGFDPFEKEIAVAEGATDMDLGSVKLMPKSLNTVVIEGEFTPLQIRGDTIEYDARAFEVKEHDVVEDLLKQLPGVEVAEDGSIKVQGKDVEQVLVDGEKFFGDDVNVTTKNLPANAVKKVQVFDKKSDMSEFTGVDDGSESPTINLTLKESHKKGYFGNVELAGGAEIPDNNTPRYDRYEAKANVFSFKKKWQISVIGIANNINKTGFSWQDYANFMGGAQNIKRGGGDIGGINISGGDPDDGFLDTYASGVNVTYKPSKKTTFSSSFFFNNFNKTFTKTLERETYFTDSTLYTNELADQSSNSYNGRGDIFFEQKFDSTHYLNINFSGDIGQTVYLNDSWVDNFEEGQNQLSSFNTGLNQTDFNYSINSGANYRKKFKKNGRFTGIDVSYDRSNSDVTTYLDYVNDLFTNGVPTEIIISQDQFLLETTEDIGASWTWSEPITLHQLLQLDLGVDKNAESKDRDVFDNVAESDVLNTILTGDGDYSQLHYNGELRHKFFSKKVSTTLGAKYKHLVLSGANIFTTNEEFDYLLPNFLLEWDPNKKSNVKLRYSTSIKAPSLNQLQPLQDNTNPSSIILGNLDLTPEYNHTVMLRFWNYNQFNFSFFMARISGTYTQNNVVYSQKVNEFYVTELTPQNIGDEKSMNAFVTYGLSINAIKTKIRLSANGNVSNGAINFNKTRDTYTNYSASPSLSFENIGKKILDLRTGISVNYSWNTYAANENFNTKYQNWNYYLNTTFKIKDRWEINPKINHYFYPGFDNNDQLVLIDFTVACNFLKSRELQVYATAKDLLNQNTGLSQYYLQNMYEREVTQTLGRYIMLGLKYSFKRFGKHSKKAEE